MNQTEGPIAYTAIPDKVTRNAHAAFASDPAARIAKNAVSASPIRKVARVPEALSLDASTFDVQLSPRRHHQPEAFGSLLDVRKPEHHALSHHEEAEPEDV